MARAASGGAATPQAAGLGVANTFDLRIMDKQGGVKQHQLQVVCSGHCDSDKLIAAVRRLEVLENISPPDPDTDALIVTERATLVRAHRLRTRL